MISRRRYATVASDSSNADDVSHLSWPDPPRGHRYPTPYQILSLQQRDAYTKQRFYELVKVYHPDRAGNDGQSSLPCSHPCRNITHTARLERYRLIVAAHGILSDPDKRRAYDISGAGWIGTPNTSTRDPYGRPTWGGAGSGGGAPAGPFSGWREHRDPNIWANATWEDWERFYARGDPNHPLHQEPLYLRNSYFVTVVLVLVLVGMMANVGRAETAGDKFLEARDAMHDRASKELRKVRQQSEARPKDERIQFFLRQREATMSGVGVDEVRQEKLDKLLPKPESCMGEELREELDRERGR